MCWLSSAPKSCWSHYVLWFVPGCHIVKWTTLSFHSLTEMSLVHPDGLQGCLRYLKMSHCDLGCTFHHLYLHVLFGLYFNMFLFLLNIFKKMSSRPLGPILMELENAAMQVLACHAAPLYWLAPLLTVSCEITIVLVWLYVCVVYTWSHKCFPHQQRSIQKLSLWRF